MGRRGAGLFWGLGRWFSQCCQEPHWFHQPMPGWGIHPADGIPGARFSTDTDEAGKERFSSSQNPCLVGEALNCQFLQVNGCWASCKRIKSLMAWADDTKGCDNGMDDYGSLGHWRCKHARHTPFSRQLCFNSTPNRGIGCLEFKQVWSGNERKGKRKPVLAHVSVKCWTHKDGVIETSQMFIQEQF